jgi:hypothetical protein
MEPPPVEIVFSNFGLVCRVLFACRLFALAAASTFMCAMCVALAFCLTSLTRGELRLTHASIR